MKLLSLTLLLSLLFSLFFVRPIYAQLPDDWVSYLITGSISRQLVSQTGEIFFTKELEINYKSGPVIISASGEGIAAIAVDDAITVEVTKPNGEKNTVTHEYFSDCQTVQGKEAQDIQNLFAPGINKVKVMLHDVCGGHKFSSDVYILTQKPDPIPEGPQPFLDLPWDYEANGMTFNEAATSINAYFDHNYPFLSTSLTEPPLIVRYFDHEPVNDDYSKHDGYDYGNRAKTKLNTPQLAAADGEATYLGSCTACGNAILIDHKNGFQTRYYHLQPDELIVSQEGQKVNVIKGQKIGKVGFTGNVWPQGETGAHIHFMVVQDKNNDGNFEDNIPDGLVDPFGWQSTEPDPWENYAFNYAGKEQTGNKSYYLFTKKLDNLDATLTSNQAVFNIGKTKLEFPQNSTIEDLKLIATTEPNFTNGILNSLGSIINIIAKTQTGNPVTSFLADFILTIDFSQFDLSRYNLDTLSIYSSQDGENWTKEETTIDFNTKTASASINHLTYFALMAERKDTVPPTTTLILNGQKGENNNFRSDVTLDLNSQDNENGLGVEFTAYGFEDQPWQTYTSPITFSEEGSYKIYFYSQDKDDNLEEIKSVEFKIDKTPPEAKIEVDQSSWDLKVQPVATDSAITKKSGKKLGETIYTLKDSAGNILVIESQGLNSTYIDLLKLNSLKYNSDPKIPLPDNLLDVNYIFYTPKKRPEIKVINQNFAIKNEVGFVIIADALKNKTVLNILENGRKRKEEKPGVTLLKLQTNKGKLEYNY